MNKAILTFDDLKLKDVIDRIFRSSLFYNMSARYERYESNTSATRTAQV